MSIRLSGIALCAIASLFTNNASAQISEIESLRIAIDELRVDYESRIAALEQRLAIAEQWWLKLRIQSRNRRDISGTGLELCERSGGILRAGLSLRW